MVKRQPPVRDAEIRRHLPCTHSICGVRDGKSKTGLTGGKAGTSSVSKESSENETKPNQVSQVMWEMRCTDIRGAIRS